MPTIDIMPTFTYDFYTSPGQIMLTVTFIPSDEGMVTGLGPTVVYTGTLGSPANHAGGIFTDEYDMASYYASAAAAAMATNANNLQPYVTYTAGVMKWDTDRSIYTINALIAADVPAVSNPTRALNTVYQNTTGKYVLANTTVDIATSLTLTGGATGTVILEYADNSGISTNVVTANSTVNGNTGTLTIGLSLTQTASATLTGVIPPGKYYRYRTVNTTGTPTFTFRSTQETTL